jgi:hypothetical protein
LSVPNKVWASFGALLHRIVSPVVLGILFFAVIAPFGVVMKMFRKDPLQLRKEPGFESYWVRRELQPVNKKSMSNQF